MLYKMIRPSTMKALHLVGAAAIGAASAAGFAQVPATRMMDSPTNAGTFHYGGHIFAGPVLGAAAGSYEEEMARPGTTAPVTLAAAYGKFHHQLERGSDELAHEVGVMTAQLVKSESNLDVVSTLFNHDELLCAAVPPSPATHPHTRSLHTLHPCPPPTRTRSPTPRPLLTRTPGASTPPPVPSTHKHTALAHRRYRAPHKHKHVQRGRNGSTRLRHVPRRSQLVASHLVDDNERLKTEIEGSQLRASNLVNENEGLKTEIEGSQFRASYLANENEGLKTEIEGLKKEQAKLRAQLGLQTTTEQPTISNTSDNTAADL